MKNYIIKAFRKLNGYTKKEILENGLTGFILSFQFLATDEKHAKKQFKDPFFKDYYILSIEEK